MRVTCFSHPLRISSSLVCALIAPRLRLPRPLLPRPHISLQHRPRRCSPRNRLLRNTRGLGLQLVQTLPLGQDTAGSLQLGLLGLGVVAQINGLGLREEGGGGEEAAGSMALA